MSLLSFDDNQCSFIENKERCNDSGEDYSIRTGSWFCPEHYSKVEGMQEQIWQFGKDVLDYKKREETKKWKTRS